MLNGLSISLLVLAASTLVLSQEQDTSNVDNNPAKQHTINLGKAVVCDCGFIDESNNLWTDIWYSNYANFTTANLQYNKHYLVMDYTVNAKHKDTLSRVFSPQNVKIDSKQGITLSVKNTNGKYTSAAIGTKRTDFLYGTYRARMKTSSISGTVAAFYFYRNDSSEIDMESLSRWVDPYKTYFAIQPQIYEQGEASNLTNEKHTLDYNPTEDYHEYRFDWLPGSVKFYIDSQLVREMTTNIPDAPGRIMMNHWTDGNPNFSGGPPAQDSDLSVSHLNMFFNSSETKGPPACAKSKTPCKVADIMSRNLLPGSEIVSNAAAAAASIPKASITALLGLLFVFFFMSSN